MAKRVNRRHAGLLDRSRATTAPATPAPIRTSAAVAPASPLVTGKVKKPKKDKKDKEVKVK